MKLRPFNDQEIKEAEELCSKICSFSNGYSMAVCLSAITGVIEMYRIHISQSALSAESQARILKQFKESINEVFDQNEIE